MKYRYGYMKRGDSPRLTKKSAALRAIERAQVREAGVIECWFTADDLAPQKPCDAVYSEFAHAHVMCKCGFMAHQHENIIRGLPRCIRKAISSSSKSQTIYH